MFATEGLDPHAAGVVHVPGDHADRASRRSRDGRVPEFGGQVLNEIGGDAIVRPPASEEGRVEVSGCSASIASHATILSNSPMQSFRWTSAGSTLNSAGCES